MLTLRTDEGFKFRKHKELFNLTVSKEFIKKAEEFEKLGLLNISRDAICLKEKGFLVSNAIISELLSTEIL